VTRKYLLSLNHFYTSNQRLLFIILLAVIIRLALYIFVAPWNNHVLETKILVLDAGGYHDLALKLLNSKSFENFGTFRTPGYPLFLAIIYFIFGIKPWIVLLLQIIANVLSLILVFRLGLLIFNQKIALLIAFFFAIEPHQVFYSLTLLSDTLFVTFFLLSSIYLVSGISKTRIQNFLFSGFFLGISTLIKPISVLFPAMIILYFLVKWPFKKHIKYLLIYIVAFIITLSPWLIRNYANYGYLQLSSITGTNLLFYNVAATEAEKTGLPLDSIQEKFIDIAEKKGAFPENNPFVNSNIYSDIAYDYILSNWADFSIRHLKGIVNMFIGLSSQNIAQFLDIKSNKLNIEQFSAPSLLDRFIDFFKTKSLGEIVLGLTIAVFLLLCYTFFIAGSFNLIIMKDIFFLIFILLIICYFSVITGVVGMSRYKLPITPFYLIICAKGFFDVLPKISGFFVKFVN
jgi:hypothetical protein